MSAVNCPVVHLVMREGLSSVFEAMVAAPLGKLHERGLDTRLVVFSRMGEFIRNDPRRRWRDRLNATRENYDRPVHRLPSPPARAQSLWSEAWLLKKWITRHIGTDQPAILHCRGPEAADVALRVRLQMPKLKVIFDMRGVVDAEYLYEKGLSPGDPRSSDVDGEYRRLGQIQQRAALDADAIFCVSHAMADYAVERLGGVSKNITVLRCSTRRFEVDRQAMRLRLGLKDRFVVAFSGGTQRWQMPQQSAKVFQAIKRLRPNAHFLVLTLNPGQMRSVLEPEGINQNDVTILSVPHADVPQYLAVADLGLLLRDRSIVNAVASPVKFSEFLECGVPVAISHGLGDLSSLVEQRQIGVVIDPDDLRMPQTLREFLESYDHDGLSRLCCKAARDELDLDRNIERTIHVYGQLCLDTCESCT